MDQGKIERILTDYVTAHPNFCAVLLRYFNPIGAHESGLLGWKATHTVEDMCRSAWLFAKGDGSILIGQSKQNQPQQYMLRLIFLYQEYRLPDLRKHLISTIHIRRTFFVRDNKYSILRHPYSRCPFRGGIHLCTNLPQSNSCTFLPHDKRPLKIAALPNQRSFLPENLFGYFPTDAHHHSRNHRDSSFRFLPPPADLYSSPMPRTFQDDTH